jgi:hypothetical protein
MKLSLIIYFALGCLKIPEASGLKAGYPVLSGGRFILLANSSNMVPIDFSGKLFLIMSQKYI